MTEQEKFEYIEQYLNGQMTSEEVEQFEQLMITDKDFAEEVSQHQQLNEVIFDAGLLDVKKRVKNLQYHRPTGAGHSGNHVSLAKKGLIGLGGLVIVASVLWLSSNMFGEKPQEVTGTNGQQSTEKPQLNNSTNSQYPTNQNATSGKRSDANANEPREENPNKRKQPVPEKIQPSRQEVNVQDLSEDQLSEAATAPTLSEAQAMNPDLPETRNFDPCQNTRISANPKTLPSCEAEASGKIVIDSNAIYGGEPPYQFFIEETDRLVTDYSIDGLEPGTYTLIVMDSRDCSETFANLHIESKNCNARQEHVFVPAEQDKWEYPVDGNASGELEIRARNGQQILKTQIRNGIPEGWKGRKESGQPAPMGAYQVIFTPFDGQTRVWLLTVIR